MGKCKAKSIQTDLGILTHIPVYWGIFRHIKAYSGIIQGYCEPCATLAYSEPWYIQNSGTFRTRNAFRILGYSEPWFIQNSRHTYLRWSALWNSYNGYNYFRKLQLFSQYQLFMSDCTSSRYTIQRFTIQRCTIHA